MVGSYSEIVVEALANDLDCLKPHCVTPVISSSNHRCSTSFVNIKPRFRSIPKNKDTYSININDDTVKYNQMGDVLRDQKEAYERFTIEIFFPTLEELGITVARMGSADRRRVPHHL